MVTKTILLMRSCCDPDCMTTVARTHFDDAEIRERAEAFGALGDEIRMKIIRLLSQHDSLCVCEIQEAFDVGQPTVSHHLKILRDAGLVDVQRRGTWAYYSLRTDALKRLAKELVEI